MSIKRLIKTAILILPSAIQRNIYWNNNRVQRHNKIKKWESRGKPLPPPHQYKQLIIEQISKKYQLKYFVETGTFLGHMIEAQRNNFLSLYSIEVEPNLYMKAYKYFMPYKHIKLVQGDSAIKLKEVLDEIGNQPVLFWLDGHYSGENTGMGDKQCPVYDELEIIFNKVIAAKYILIDDARCFDGTNDYPSINELKDFVGKKEKGLQVKILNDIIHIY